LSHLARVRLIRDVPGYTIIVLYITDVVIGFFFLAIIAIFVFDIAILAVFFATVAEHEKHKHVWGSPP
jgi:hypothetical protein